MLDGYIYGFGRQQLSVTAGEAPPEDLAAAMLSAVPAADDPHLHRMVLLAVDVGYDAEADFDFDFALDVILDGLGRVLSTSETSRCQLPLRARSTHRCRTGRSSGI